MPRPDKVAAVDEVRGRLEASAATVLTEYRGLTVGQLGRLRAQLRDSGAQYRIVKNTLTRLAVREAGFEVPDDLLTGPTAATFCADDPVAATKVLRAFSREHPQLVIKGGLFEGRFLGAAQTLRLADLGTREEQLSQFAGMAMTLVARPARLALAGLEKPARLAQALADRRQAAEEQSAAA
jgi:large subunit ribosomal protein L10